MTDHPVRVRTSTGWQDLAIAGPQGPPGPQGPQGPVGSGAGDVTGPASATDNNITLFNGATGKVLKDSGVAISSVALLASPTFTGDPKAPTPTAGDSDTSIATTAFVANALASLPPSGVSQSYVDTADNLRVLKAGDVMTGNLTTSGSLTGANITSNTGTSTGIYYFGGNAAHYVTFNGSNYLIAGADCKITGNVFVGASASVGTLYLGSTGASFLGWNGTSITVSPSLLLLAGTNAAPSLAIGVANTGLLYNAAGTSIIMSIGGQPAYTFGSSYLSTNLAVRTGDGSYISPAYSFGADFQSGIYRKGSGSVSISILQNEVMNWNSTGKTTTAYGPIVLPADPTTALQAATKQYVDNKPSGIADAPNDGSQYARQSLGWAQITSGVTQAYVDTADALRVRYDIAQGLTAAQQSQARANINVTKKNYIINGAMMISQENGATAGTTTNYYPVDQWFLLVSSGSVSVSQQASRTPSGSPNRISCTVTGVAGFTLFQRLEGGRVADLMLGTGSAKIFTVQFGVNTVAGTHRVTVTPGGGGAGIVVNFTVSAGEAGTDVVKSATFSAITTGTYPTDNTCGVQLDISPTMPAGGVFQLFDVSLTEGTVAPPFQVPDYNSEILACQRYYQILARVVAYGGAAFNYQGIYFLTAMRTIPTITPAWDAGGSATFDSGTTSAFFTGITAGISGGSLKLNARL